MKQYRDGGDEADAEYFNFNRLDPRLYILHR